MRLNEIGKPSPKQDEVLLHISKVGICGTDREINAGLYGSPPDGSSFLVAGHESIGIIEEVGEKVSRFTKGELVVPTVRRACPENCLNCRNGESDMCLSGHYYEHGIYKLHGFASEFAVSNSNYLVKVPPSITDVGVLLEPTSIVEKAIFQTYAIQKRMNWEPKTALMFGAGPIGQLGTALLRLRGLAVQTVARRPPTDPKAKLIESMGATYLSVNDTATKELGSFDIIIEGTGNAAVALEAMNHLNTNGALCLVGVYSPLTQNLEAGQIFRKMVLQNQLVFGSVNANKRYFEMGIKDFQEIRTRYGNLLERFITARVAPENYAEAYQPSPGEIKSVIEFA